MLIYAAVIGLIVLILGGMGAALYYNNKAEKRNRMLAVVSGASGGVSTIKGQESDHEKNKRREAIARRLRKEEDDEEEEGHKKKEGLAELIPQAGFEFTLTQFWIGALVSGVVSTIGAYAMGMDNFVIVMAFVIGFFGLPKMFLKRRAAKRQKQFLSEFPEALESMMRLLKAGMPVGEAVKMVAREYEGPMGEEMGRIYDQQKIGTPLPEAALLCARRMPIPEMKMFATALSIQAQTGSSLSEVLQNLAKVIRARFALKRKVQALSSEAKSSAMIIGALPIVVGGGMYFINREYIEILFIDPFGKTLLAGAILWMGCGVLMMKQMINFKI